MKKFAANLVSIILIPLIAPSYLYWIILFYFPQITRIQLLSEKILAIFYIFMATTFLPFVVVFILYKRKVITDLTLHRQQDRVIPQIFSCFIYAGICAFLVYTEGPNNALSLSLIAVSVSVVGLTLITPFWKISAHACGAWGLFAIVYELQSHYHQADFQVIYYIILFLTISVSAARLYLRVHTVMQVIAGGIMGGAVGFLLFHYCLTPYHLV